MNLSPATKPTLYFIGVTTKSSSIMKVFPLWAKLLNIEYAQIIGIDLEIHADPKIYRDVVSFIKHDKNSLGALVTTHKLDLFSAAKDLFDYIDPHAELMSEVSCISKRGNTLNCHAKDPISSGLAIDAFLPSEHFSVSPKDLFSMGAGGSTIAITWHLLQKSRGENRPKRIFISNRTPERLEHIRKVHKILNVDIPIEYILAEKSQDNDVILSQLKSGSLVINATGLGKDAPGSPLSDKAVFPTGGIAWDLNYRGELIFLEQANRQKQSQNLQIENGWTYFIHGWTQVISEVFDVEIPLNSQVFESIEKIAAEVTGRS